MQSAINLAKDGTSIGNIFCMRAAANHYDRFNSLGNLLAVVYYYELMGDYMKDVDRERYRRALDKTFALRLEEILQSMGGSLENRLPAPASADMDWDAYSGLAD